MNNIFSFTKNGGFATKARKLSKILAPTMPKIGHFRHFSKKSLRL